MFVDTELWIYSIKEPNENKYSNTEIFEQDTQKHLHAITFFKTLMKDTIFFFTTHQICELYHVLRFRGTKLDVDFVHSYMTSIITSKTSRVIEASLKDVKKSIDLSIASNIHVWDFLCIVPLKDKIDMIYTSDKHFTHQSMKDLGIPIENPIGTWDVL